MLVQRNFIEITCFNQFVPSGTSYICISTSITSYPCTSTRYWNPVCIAKLSLLIMYLLLLLLWCVLLFYYFFETPRVFLSWNYGVHFGHVESMKREIAMVKLTLPPRPNWVCARARQDPRSEPQQWWWQSVCLSSFTIKPSNHTADTSPGRRRWQVKW
jgi:hypothetical protein